MSEPQDHRDSQSVRPLVIVVVLWLLLTVAVIWIVQFGGLGEWLDR